jgi:UDP-glucuronate 4-epimerase
MKTVLVTGSAGFIGSNTIRELLNQKEVKVVGVDNFDDTYERSYKEENIANFINDENFTNYEVDIVDLKSLERIFENEKPTHVLHLAAKADTRNAVLNPYTYIKVNITGTLNIFECAKKYEVENVVAASSSSVYGNNPNVPWSEEQKDILPISPYGTTKLSTEYLAYTYHKNFNMNITMLRYFNVYGENNRPGMVPYRWAEAMLTDGKIEISGDGERKRDYTYVGDTVRGTMAALWKPLGFEIINLGHGSPLSLNELLELFKNATGKKPDVHSRQSHPASVEVTYADTQKAKKLLDWEPEISHEEGIQRLLDWFRQSRLK